MIKRICDCCGAEIDNEFIQFNISYHKADAINGNVLGKKDIKTDELEYCGDCFHKVLEKLHLVRS